MNFVSKVQNVFSTVLKNVNIKRNYIKYFHFAFPVAYCAEHADVKKPFEFSNHPALLTHEFLIKQAAGAVVGSALQLLTQTVVAIADTAEQYKDVIKEQITLLEESKLRAADPAAQQEISDLLVASRSKLTDVKKQFYEFESLLEYVEKVVTSTTEVSYLAGGEYQSASLSHQLSTARLEVMKVKKSIEELENDCLLLQKHLIYDSSDPRIS